MKMETTQKKPKARLPKLTKQDDVFVERVIETGNLTKSVQEGYGIEDPRYAAVKGQRLIRKDNIIEAIEVKRKSLRQALIDKGITEDYLAEKVQTLLTGVDKEGNSDYTAIDKGLKHATSIYGVEDPDSKPKGQNTYNFIFNKETQADIKEIENKIKARLIQKHEHSQEN